MNCKNRPGRCGEIFAGLAFRLDPAEKYYGKKIKSCSVWRMLSLAAGFFTPQGRAKASMNQARPEGLGAIECTLATMAAASEATLMRKKPQESFDAN